LSTGEVKRIRSSPSLTPIPAEPTVSVESTMYEESESTKNVWAIVVRKGPAPARGRQGSADRDASPARSYPHRPAARPTMSSYRTVSRAGPAVRPARQRQSACLRSRSYVRCAVSGLSPWHQATRAIGDQTPLGSPHTHMGEGPQKDEASSTPKRPLLPHVHGISSTRVLPTLQGAPSRAWLLGAKIPRSEVFGLTRITRRGHIRNHEPMSGSVIGYEVKRSSSWCRGTVGGLGQRDGVKSQVGAVLMRTTY
jgi:hypothetical protein